MTTTQERAHAAFARSRVAARREMAERARDGGAEAVAEAAARTTRQREDVARLYERLRQQSLKDGAA